MGLNCPDLLLTRTGHARSTNGIGSGNSRIPTGLNIRSRSIDIDAGSKITERTLGIGDGSGSHRNGQRFRGRRYEAGVLTFVPGGHYHDHASIDGGCDGLI